MKKVYSLMMKFIFICWLVLASFLAGNDFSDAKDTGNKEVKIITSFYPMYIMTLNLIKNIPGVKLVNLTPPQTGCLHDYQLMPSDMETLATGTIFIANGAGMESFLDKVIRQYPNLKIVIASSNIDLLANQTSAEKNPHVWVSISLAIKEVGNIAEALQKDLPMVASKIAENSLNYVSKLELLRAKMHASLDKIRNKEIVTFHEAFPYFAREFNLNIVEVVEREPGSAPSAKELSGIIEKVRKSRVKALFAEPQYPAKAAQTIAAETSAKVYFLDPAVQGPNTADAYLDIMEKNLKTLEEALK